MRSPRFRCFVPSVEPSAIVGSRCLVTQHTSHRASNQVSSRAPLSSSDGVRIGRLAKALAAALNALRDSARRDAEHAASRSEGTELAAKLEQAVAEGRSASEYSASLVRLVELAAELGRFEDGEDALCAAVRHTLPGVLHAQRCEPILLHNAVLPSPHMRICPDALCTGMHAQACMHAEICMHLLMCCRLS